MIKILLRASIPPKPPTEAYFTALVWYGTQPFEGMRNHEGQITMMATIDFPRDERYMQTKAL